MSCMWNGFYGPEVEMTGGLCCNDEFYFVECVPNRGIVEECQVLISISILILLVGLYVQDTICCVLAFML